MSMVLPSSVPLCFKPVDSGWDKPPYKRLWESAMLQLKSTVTREHSSVPQPTRKDLNYEVILDSVFVCLEAHFKISQAFCGCTYTVLKHQI